MKFQLLFLVLAVAFITLVNANGSNHKNLQTGELAHVLGLHKGHHGQEAGCNGFGNRNGQGPPPTSPPSTTTVSSGK